MYAARRDHIERLIAPALARGEWVISDRFADSTRAYQGAGGAVVTEPLAPPEPRGAFSLTVSGLYDRVLSVVPRGGRSDVDIDVNPDAPSFDWQPNLGPDRREELRLALEGGVTPYIRRTADGRLLVSVAEPARRGNQSVGIVLLTREAREVDQRLFEIRASVLGIFGVALVLTVALSFYLAQTLANPIMQLAGSAAAMRQGEGRSGSVPPSCANIFWNTGTMNTSIATTETSDMMSTIVG